MKIFILVMWFGHPYLGPSVTTFDSLAACEAVRLAVATEYLPRHTDDPDSWTAYVHDIEAYKRSKCLTTQVVNK